jgi:uncharacterized protein YjbI with pentapeptide repeats
MPTNLVRTHLVPREVGFSQLVSEGVKPTVFIGHGRSDSWRELIPLIRNKGFEHEEFNSHPVAGHTASQRLELMLSRAHYALLVLTAEDEHNDGSLHPRENVIHEAGLFQGRLGFERAVILVEEGCSTFSNIAGLQTIGFPKGNLRSAFVRLRRLLEAWSGSDVWDGAKGGLSTADPVRRTAEPRRSFAISSYGFYGLAGSGLVAWFVWSVLQAKYRYGEVACMATLYAIAVALIRWSATRLRETLRGSRIKRLYAAGERRFTQLQLTRAELSAVVLRGGDFTTSILYRAVLTKADLTGTLFRKADLREAQLDLIEAQTADLTDAMLNGAYLREANLGDANLSRSDLADSYLNRAVLHNANLQGANLQHAHLYKAHMNNVNMRGANLRKAVLCYADLRDADLRDTDMRSADVTGADLRGADMTGADCEDCNLADAVR